MPNMFQFISKETGEAERFLDIDDKMCKGLNVKCDSEAYFNNWRGSVGMSVAYGKKLSELILEAQNYLKEDPDDSHYQDRLRVLVWLDEHYTTKAWAESSSY